MSVSYNRKAVLSLYRSILKDASKFVNYNFREHARRRIIGEFHANKALSADGAEAKFRWGLEQAKTAKRQAAISQLYPEESSVVANRSRVKVNAQ
jgi:L-cysteine desulfidase